MERNQLFIVLAVITNEKGEVLLAKRNEPAVEYAHNKWELIGGGIEFGEDPIDALKREVKEEAGVEIKIIKLLPKIITHIWDLGEKQEQIIMMSYECKITGGKLSPGLNEEIAELKFVPIEQTKQYDTLPNVYEIVKLINS